MPSLPTPISANPALLGDPVGSVGMAHSAFAKSTLDAVARYIRNQEAHHRKMSYEQEFIALLEKHGVAYDPEDVFR